MSLTRFLMVAGALALTASSSFAQAVIYRETFGTTVDQQPIANIGWITYTGNGTANAQLANNAQSSLGLATGKPTDLPNVNAGSSDSMVSGVGFVASGNGTNDLFTYTNEYLVDRSSFTDISFTWWAASRYSNLDTQRIVVQIGGVWYASNNPIVPPGVGSGANFNSGAQQFNLDLTSTASDWRTVNFQVGTPLTLGSVLGSALPSGNITGFGLYVELGNYMVTTPPTSNPTDESSRFDTYTILANPIVPATTAPEPSALALVATGILSGLAVRRYRRSA
jgi:hypothetical protein